MGSAKRRQMFAALPATSNIMHRCTYICTACNAIYRTTVIMPRRRAHPPARRHILLHPRENPGLCIHVAGSRGTHALSSQASVARAAAHASKRKFAKSGVYSLSTQPRMFKPKTLHLTHSHHVFLNIRADQHLGSRQGTCVPGNTCKSSLVLR